MSYAEQLKKPQWQKKRLEILERDEWTCQTCGDTEATLTVHHKSYQMVEGKFVDVWNYNDCDLKTLCLVCHQSEEENLKSLSKDAFYKLRDCCEDAEVIDLLLIELYNYKTRTGSRILVPDVLDFFGATYGQT